MVWYPVPIPISNPCTMMIHLPPHSSLFLGPASCFTTFSITSLCPYKSLPILQHQHRPQSQVPSTMGHQASDRPLLFTFLIIIFISFDNPIELLPRSFKTQSNFHELSIIKLDHTSKGLQSSALLQRILKKITCKN